MRAPLQTERMPDGRRRLLRDLTVVAGGLTFLSKKGEITDFSSLPFWARWVVRWSRVDIAGVVHDKLYREGIVSRRTADYIWRLIAVDGDHHANWAQAWVCWVGLRVGGWWVWRKYRKAA